MPTAILQRIPRPWRVTAAVLWALAIPALSLLPARFFRQAATVVSFPHADKLVHAIMYGVLTGLLLGAWPGQPPRSRRYCLVAATATAYGLLMELLQRLTPTRSTDILDALANAVGAFLVAGVALGVAAIFHRNVMKAPNGPVSQ